MTEEEVLKVAEKLSDIGVSISFDNFVLSGIVSLVSVAVGVFLGAYLKKKGEDKALKEGFDDVKDRLKQSTVIVEQIKNDIAKEKHGYNFKFEKYHEKRIEVIEKLYELILQLEEDATTYIITANFGDGQSAEFKKAKSAIEEFIKYSNLKIFWVPEKLYNEIEELARLLDRHVYSVLSKLGAKTVQNRRLEQGIRANDEAIDALKNKVPRAKRNIVESVRSLLDPDYS